MININNIFLFILNNLIIIFAYDILNYNLLYIFFKSNNLKQIFGLLSDSKERQMILISGPGPLVWKL